MTRQEELKQLRDFKYELRERQFQSVTNDILTIIELLDYADVDKKIIKYNIEQMIYKMCESEEILNDNLRILDQYASNGLENRKRR